MKRGAACVIDKRLISGVGQTLVLQNKLEGKVILSDGGRGTGTR